MSFSEIWHRRLRYMLSPQLDLYDRIGERFCRTQPGPELPFGYVRVRDPQPSVLDYGCGLGFGMLRLAHGQAPDVTGVDSDPSAIELARSVLGTVLRFEVADALRPDGAWERIRARRYKVLTAIEVIEHVPINIQSDLISALAEVVTDDGLAVFSTPNSRSQFRKHAGHVGVHDPVSLHALLLERFEVVTLEDFMGRDVDYDTVVSPIVAVCSTPIRS